MALKSGEGRDPGPRYFIWTSSIRFSPPQADRTASATLSGRDYFVIFSEEHISMSLAFCAVGPVHLTVRLALLPFLATQTS